MTFEGIVLLHAVALYCPGQVEDAVDCVRCLAKPVLKAGRDVLKSTLSKVSHGTHCTTLFCQIYSGARIPEKVVRHK